MSVWLNIDFLFSDHAETTEDLTVNSNGSFTFKSTNHTIVMKLEIDIKYNLEMLRKKFESPARIELSTF